MQIPELLVPNYNVMQMDTISIGYYFNDFVKI